jgi:hypothetical protein
MSPSLVFVFGRMIFASGILLIGMALAGKGPRSMVGRGAAERAFSVLFGASIAMNNLHFVVDMSAQAQGIANAACLLLLLAAVGSNFLRNRRER